MEYELNGYNALVLKKILILFRHISLDLQIIASDNGLNLYALNPSNSVWLHIQLGRSFFERIQFKGQNTQSEESSPNVKHWFVSTKHLCQSLSIVCVDICTIKLDNMYKLRILFIISHQVIPPGQKNSPFGSVLIKDLHNHENLKNSFGLDRLIIREYQDNVDFLSLIFICSNKNIVRSATLGFQEYKLSIPDELGWSNWHYLRISPSVFYKSISPFSSQYNDLSITYNDSKEDLLLNVINNKTKLTGNKNKKEVVSGKVLINSRHFHKLDLDDDLSHPTDITISIKEFLSLVSFCESVKCPLSLILRKPGDPVIALFGGSVEACESVTTNLNIHNIVYNGCNESNSDSGVQQISDQNILISGCLWISSFKGKRTDNLEQDQEEEEEKLEDSPDKEFDLFKSNIEKEKDKPQYKSKFTEQELDLMYKVLIKDFENQ